MGDRQAIPAELERAVMLEAGYRCAVPTCRTVSPLHIEHIEDYARVQKHEFHNMIVLCANCHGMKGVGPRRLDRKALRQLKVNLGRVTQRYNDTERRILEHFVENGPESLVVLPGSEVLYSYLIKDGVLVEDPEQEGMLVAPVGCDGEIISVTTGYRLTPLGRDLVKKYAENEALED